MRAVDRRREPRTTTRTDVSKAIDVPGVTVLAVVDVSDHGLCCRLRQPVRPGRPATLRVGAGHAATRIPVVVVRCSVATVTSDQVEYVAAWRCEAGWPWT